MSPIKKLPLKVRYARGKVRHLASPLLWFPLGIVCLLGVFVWELSVNPKLVGEEEFSAENNAAGEELSTDEVNAIAADIDSSAFLIKELETNAPAQREQIVVPTNVLEEYMQESDSNLRLLERTKKELSSIYENTNNRVGIENLGENSGSLFNLENNQNLGQYPLPTSNKSPSNPTPVLPPSFNLSNPENRPQNSQNRQSSLEAAMQEYLDYSDSSELLESGLAESEGYNEDFRIENTQLPQSLPNNQNYANPRVINSGDRPYYSDRYGGYDNTIQQNKPYYNNLNPSSGINTPKNQPYYSDIYNNNLPTKPTQLNTPNLVPVAPNNPYSRTRYPYSGKSPYSANQGYPQFKQNPLYNGTNYYQENYGVTPQPQPYNNYRSNPFNRQFGEQNHPFNNR